MSTFNVSVSACLSACLSLCVGLCVYVCVCVCLSVCLQFSPCEASATPGSPGGSAGITLLWFVLLGATVSNSGMRLYLSSPPPPLPAPAPAPLPSHPSSLPPSQSGLALSTTTGSTTFSSSGPSVQQERGISLGKVMFSQVSVCWGRGVSGGN